MDMQKRRKNYFSNGNYQKKRKNYTLEPGMIGFLCTCNFREKDCVRDAYKLLNEFADEIYGTNKIKEPEATDEKTPSTNAEEDVDDVDQEEEEEDISTALNKEINELKAEYAKPVSARRFQVVDTGAKNVIFIKTTLPSPVELVSKIVTELDKTKKQRTRYLLRLLPIEVICKAFMNDIRPKAEILLEKYFSQEPKTFSIVFSRHSNNSIVRDEIIEDLAGIVSKKNPGNKADLNNPELAVIVEVIRGICLMSVVPNYYKYKKYNLLEICTNKTNKEPATTTDPEESTEKKSEEEDKKEDSKEETDSSKEVSDEKEKKEEGDNTA